MPVLSDDQLQERLTTPTTAPSLDLSYLKTLGYSDAGIAGIRDNLMRESKGDTKALGDYEKGLPTSFGLGQWHKERWDALKAYAKAQGKPWHDQQTQLSFLDKELKEQYPQLRAELMSSTDAKKAEEDFRVKYERPKGTPTAAPKLAAGTVLSDEDLLARMGGATPQTTPRRNTAAWMPADEALPWYKRWGAQYAQGAGMQETRSPLDRYWEWAKQGPLYRAATATDPQARREAIFETATGIGQGMAGGGGLERAGGMAREFAATGPAVRAPATTPGQLAREAGFVISPSEALAKGENVGSVANAITGIAGRPKNEAAMSAANQTRSAEIAAEDLGLPKDTKLTEDVFSKVYAREYKAYDAVKTAPVVLEKTPDYAAKIANLGTLEGKVAEQFPTETAAAVDKLRQTMQASERYTPDAAVEQLKQLRADARGLWNKYKRSKDPADQALARAHDQAASALEELIETRLAEAGFPDLVANMRQARQNIAKTHNIHDATDTDTGIVNAQKLANMREKGVPLSGGAETIARTANVFPKSMQPGAKYVPFNALEYIGTVLAGLGHTVAGLSTGVTLPLVAAALSRPAANLALRSRVVQNRLFQPPMIQPPAPRNSLLGVLQTPQRPPQGPQVTLGQPTFMGPQP